MLFQKYTWIKSGPLVLKSCAIWSFNSFISILVFTSYTGKEAMDDISAEEAKKISFIF